MKVAQLYKRLMEEAPADGGAGAAAPAAPAAPTPQEPSAPVEPSAGEANPWASLLDDSDDSPPVEPQPPAPAATEPPTQPQGAPAEPPQQQAATPQEPGQLEQQATDQQQQQETQEPQQPTPEQRAQAEQQFVAQLEKLYQFTPETAALLQTEPEKVLPNLAARLHMDVYKTVMAQMQGMVPQMVAQLTDFNTRETQAKNLLFSKWPELKGHENEVMEVGRMFRKVNPKADAETAVQRIGELTMAALGLTRAAPQGGPATPPAAPQAPAYQPAGVGHAASVPAQKNEWVELIESED